ncbi:MAG TPA: glutamate-5-semialdehyde dehydrogenase [Candidatus Goldiibacteriota bacterium]|nr:glutamate-5-semialdehyde dehydrogenase [Candidatus Goldiibacteriota bacterium]
MNEEVRKIAESAKKASYIMPTIKTAHKNRALKAIAEAFDANRQAIKAENQKDIEAGRKKGLPAPFLDRMKLDDKYIDTMIMSLSDVIKLKDPVGVVTSRKKRPNGMTVSKVRMPLGVIGIIFESRPNVCSEAASLSIKSGNSLILRGGSDSFNSNMILGRLIKEALISAGLPEGAVETINFREREAIAALLRLKEYVDVIIPRGGKGLVDFVSANSSIPVIYHDAGICHTYIDSAADLKMALKVALNAKVQRPSTCNAMETLLVHEKIAAKFLPVAAEAFRKAGVKIKAEEKAATFIRDAEKAVEQDFRTEYNSLTLNVRVVPSIEEAIAHINKYGSRHSDAIITRDKKSAARFCAAVDSAACFVNVSTRLHDGFEFGLGAEMGISNQKLHVRGPLALEGLTSEKYVVTGSGQVRE